MTSEIHRVANFQRFKLLHLDLFFAFVLAVFQLYVNKGRLLGNDYNWDLLNYHLSNVTLEQDLALHASGIQSYLPSTLDRMILPIHTLIPSPFSGLLMLVPLICNYIILRKLFIQKHCCAWIDGCHPVIRSDDARHFALAGIKRFIKMLL